MNRPILLCALMVVTAAGLTAQQGGSYEGTSNPPPDDTIVTSTPAIPKPPAGHPMQPDSGQSAQSGQSNDQVDPGVPAADQWRGDAAPNSSPYTPLSQPTLNYRPQPLAQRISPADPDGDIVHPEAFHPGEIGAGTTIRVRLLERLSTTESEKGEPFRTTVGTDVVRGGQVLIPAGAEIDGRVVEVSRGHTGGFGTLRLKPEQVILPNGSRYRLNAEVTGLPGSRNRVQDEGTIRPGSRLGRDGVEYGAAVGGGATAGALVGGPVGALTGGLVGAGFVTVHLLASHPQATLEAGTVLQFTLTEPIYLTEGSIGYN